MSEENPSGVVKSLDGIDCYIKLHPNSRNDTLVLIATDIFGYTVPSTRLLADSFSNEMQCLTVIPDLFQGTEPPSNLMNDMINLTKDNISFFTKIYSKIRIEWYMPSFLSKNSKIHSINTIQKVVHQCCELYPIRKVALVGYCWGGGTAILLSHTPHLVQVAVACHPGPVCLPEDINQISIPFGVILAGDEHMYNIDYMNNIQSILNTKHTVDKRFYLFKIYKGMKHGFAIRGDWTQSDIAACRADAFYRTVSFLKEVFREQ